MRAQASGGVGVFRDRIGIDRIGIDSRVSTAGKSALRIHPIFLSLKPLPKLGYPSPIRLVVSPNS